ncbi:MAG TPA: DUF2809 domain-containing protein [Gemmatimonadaceae bacterium]|nr:DUF2809 domain-containing protein [Gemmatimonadaceae bacterium]
MTNTAIVPRWLGSRASYLALVGITIAAGLMVHRNGHVLGAATQDVVGDALWAMMIVWAVGALAPTARLVVRGASALAICWLVELSQLYHTPGLDAVRRTLAGRLVLGSGFDPRDLVAYAGGVLVAMLLEHLAASHRLSPRESLNARECESRIE